MPYSNPTPGDVHVNRPLSNFSQKWLQDQTMFVATEAMPNSPVDKQSDLYFEFSRADFFRDEAQERADGTESQGGGFRISTSPYFAKVYAFHKDVSDRQRDNQDTPVRLDQSATQFVTMKLLLRRERLFQETFMPASAGSSIWTNELTGVAAAPSGSQFIFWDAAASDPIVDIRSGMTVVHQTTGMRPNRMCLGRLAWDTLLDNDAVLARITGGATTTLPAKVMLNLLLGLFELETIHVMDSVVNTGVAGAKAGGLNQNESNVFVAGDNALLYFAPTGLSLDQPTAGAQFSWAGFRGATPNGNRIKRFRMENLESDRIEGQMAFDYKVTAPELGFYFFNTNA